jgi:hypothetical protein
MTNPRLRIYPPHHLSFHENHQFGIILVLRERSIDQSSFRMGLRIDRLNLSFPSREELHQLEASQGNSRKFRGERMSFRGADLGWNVLEFQLPFRREFGKIVTTTTLT